VIVRETVDEEGRPIVQRTELEQKSIMEFIPAMVALALDQPTEVVQNVGDAVEGILRAAFEVIRAELPPERWEAATQRILDACRDLDTPKSK
jgi:hypothetical protein